MYHHPAIQGTAHQGLTQSINPSKLENPSSQSDSLQQLHIPSSSNSQDFNSGHQQNDTNPNNTLR